MKDRFKISDDVISRIAMTEMIRVPGVCDTNNSSLNNNTVIREIETFFLQKDVIKRVKIEKLEGAINLTLYITVYSDHKILDVALEVQKRVKNAIENITDLEISQVNVHVQNILINTN